ncbi:MAG: DUF4350 domain-containing protein, partial [Bacteroidota bacterium]
MRSSNTPFIILIAAVALGIGAIVYFLSTRTSWAEEYEIDKDEPYGVFVFHELLQRSLDEEINPIEEGLADSLASSGTERTLVYFGNKMYLDSMELVEIQDFVERGNNVFIASEQFNDPLLDSLFTGRLDELRDQYLWEYENDIEHWEEDYETEKEEVYYEEWESEYPEDDFEIEELSSDSTYLVDSVDVDLDELLRLRTFGQYAHNDLLEGTRDSTIFVTLNPVVTDDIGPDNTGEMATSFIPRKPIEVEKVVKNYAEVKTFHSWKNGIENKSELEVVRIGGSNIGDVFLQIKSGKGNYFLHSVPLSFSNYHLLRKGNFDYFNQVYQQVDFKNVLWDVSSQKYKQVFENRGSGRGKENIGNDLREPNEGPLNYILNQPALRNAWFFGLALLVIYFIFGVRRKQKEIRFIEPPKNTSIEFAETLGHMFRQEKSHHSLMKIKKHVFFEFVRERYAIKFLNIEDKERLVEMIK